MTSTYYRLFATIIFFDNFQKQISSFRLVALYCYKTGSPCRCSLLRSSEPTLRRTCLAARRDGGGFFFLPIYFRGHEEAHTAADRHVGRFVTTILFQRFRSSHWLLAGFVSGILLEKVCRDRFNNDAILLTQ